MSIILLSVLAAVPFLPAIRGQFLFDDPYLFMDTPPVASIRYRSFRQFRGDNRAMVHLFDGWLWRGFRVNDTGMDATGTVIIQPSFPWHVLSILFHIGTTLAAWGLLGLVLAPWRALAAAAIFAVHPLQVGAVGYVSGRAGIQSAFFGMLGLLHIAAGGWHWAAVPVCFYFAYKSKQDGLLYAAWAPLILWAR